MVVGPTRGMVPAWPRSQWITGSRAHGHAQPGSMGARAAITGSRAAIDHVAIDHVANAAIDHVPLMCSQWHSAASGTGLPAWPMCVSCDIAQAKGRIDYF